MKLGIRGKLFLISLALVTASAILADIHLTRNLKTTLIDQIREDLFSRLSLVERDISIFSREPHAGDQYDSLADDLGSRAGARVTIIDDAGRVLGDSDVRLSDIPNLENHLSRTEVDEALKTGRGSAIRWSDTLQKNTMYAAVPVSTPGGKWVVRAALPLADVDATISHFRSMVLTASVFAIALAGLLSFLAAHWVSKRMRSMTSIAEKMAGGDLNSRCNIEGRDEISELGRALNNLAGSLSFTLQNLKKEKKLVEQIFEGMQEGILLLDDNGRITMFNNALREMLLLGPNLKGRTIIEVFRNLEFKDLLERTALSGGPEWSEIALGDIKPRQALVHAVPLAMGVGTLVVMVDMTDLRRLESVRKEFVANVSHELRTPVASIMSAAETLINGGVNDPAVSGKFLEIIRDNSTRMSALVSDLLDLSRIEAKTYRLNIENLDVSRAVEKVFDLINENSAKKNISLTDEIRPGEYMVLADRKALEQVLFNLIDNAVKYCPEGSRTVVSALKAGGNDIRITVTDNGPGIPAEHHQRLFERFYRVDKGRSRDMGGTGLGLSIVKHLVEAMGGSAGVESTPGNGASFWFTLQGK